MLGNSRVELRIRALQAICREKRGLLDALVATAVSADLKLMFGEGRLLILQASLSKKQKDLLDGRMPLLVSTYMQGTSSRRLIFKIWPNKKAFDITIMAPSESLKLRVKDYSQDEMIEWIVERLRLFF